MYHVGDFITRIKNAYHARRKEVVMPYSTINAAIAKVLLAEGFLSKSEVGEGEGHKRIILELRYENRRPAFHEVKIISKPSLRVYKDHGDIARDKDRAMTAVFSTSEGVMTGKEAKKKGIGGELLFKIW